jgi:hypothetical protein
MLSVRVIGPPLRAAAAERFPPRSSFEFPLATFPARLPAEFPVTAGQPFHSRERLNQVATSQPRCFGWSMVRREILRRKALKHSGPLEGRIRAVVEAGEAVTDVGWAGRPL